MSRAWVLVIATACGSSAPRPAPAPLVSNKTAPALELRPGSAADDLAMVPIDSDMVIGLDVRRIIASAIWQQRIAPKVLPMMGSATTPFHVACGYDPLEVMTTLTMGVKHAGTDAVEIVAIIHGVPRDKTLACLPALEQEAIKDGGTTRRDGDVLMVTMKDGKLGALEMIGDSTMLVLVGPSASKEAITAIARSRNGVAMSPAFGEMYRKVHPGASMWLLVNGTASMLANAGFPARPKGMFGSLDVTDRLELALAFRMGSPAEATSLAGIAQNQTNSPQVQQMFDRLEVAAHQEDVDIRVSLGDAKLQALIAMVGPLLGP